MPVHAIFEEVLFVIGARQDHDCIAGLRRFLRLRQGPKRDRQPTSCCELVIPIHRVNPNKVPRGHHCGKNPLCIAQFHMTSRSTPLSRYWMTPGVSALAWILSPGPMVISSSSIYSKPGGSGTSAGVNWRRRERPLALGQLK